MDQKPRLAPANCSVVGGEKTLQAAGGREALCREIARALAQVGQADAAQVVVHVRRAHLSASVKLKNGRALPEMGFAVSDAPISEKSVKKFADQIAAAVREARL